MYGYGNADPNRQRNVVIYARVSTEHEAQISALENQIDWYVPILAQHPEWHLVRQYVDEGITGTAAHKRPSFMEMIRDSAEGEFDLILTREVSRFARNTVDTLQYTRELKARGVEVFFLNDNIRTFDGDGELRLTIMATLAQDESRKTSIRVKAGQKVSMEKGILYGTGNILGYDRAGKEMVINPEQAETVRMIYDWYEAGWGLRKIQFELEKRGRPTSLGKTNWYATVISHILQNSFYCGIITYRKEYVPDFLEQKRVKNYGELERIQVKGTHEPIISEEQYYHVQELMQSRKRTLKNNNSGRKTVGTKPYLDVWCRIMKCACGGSFNRKVWHDLGDEKQYGYQCYSSIQTGTVKTRMKKGLSTEGICKTPMISGWKLQMMAKRIFRDYLSDTTEIQTLANSILEEQLKTTEEIEDHSALIEQKEKEIEKLNKRLDNLIEMRADGEIPKETFRAKKQEIDTKISGIQKEIMDLQPKQEIVEDVNLEDKLKVLRYALKQDLDFSGDEDIPDEVIEAFVKKIIASEEGFDWYLRFPPKSDPDNPKRLTVEGRKNHAEVKLTTTPPASTPHFVNSHTGGDQQQVRFYVKIGNFTVNYEETAHMTVSFLGGISLCRDEILTCALTFFVL